MENKYYTPQIEEFRVGFECEFFNNMQDKIWKKEVCDMDLINLAYDCYEHGTVEWNDDITQTFRIKHLDSEDIESLGFKHLGSLWFEKDNCLTVNGENFIDCRIRKWKDNQIDIYNWDKDKENGIGEIIFRGDIKNKSELKVLLNQLGIK